MVIKLTSLNNEMINELLVKYPECQALIERIINSEAYNFDRDALFHIIALRTSKNVAEVLATFCRIQHNINKQIDLAQIERRRNL